MPDNYLVDSLVPKRVSNYLAKSAWFCVLCVALLPRLNFVNLHSFQGTALMELFLFHPREYELLYNCSAYEVDSIPLEKRQSKLLGIGFMGLATLYQVSANHKISSEIYFSCCTFPAWCPSGSICTTAPVTVSCSTLVSSIWSPWLWMAWSLATWVLWVPFSAPHLDLSIFRVPSDLVSIFLLKKCIIPFVKVAGARNPLWKWFLPWTDALNSIPMNWPP